MLAQPQQNPGHQATPNHNAANTKAGLTFGLELERIQSAAEPSSAESSVAAPD
jgi:hypothetical protein